MEIKVATVPGVFLTLNVRAGSKVTAVASKAAEQRSDIDWSELIKTRTVKVNNVAYSTNRADTNNIHTTALHDGDTILILALKNIKGNDCGAYYVVKSGAQKNVIDCDTTIAEALVMTGENSIEIERLEIGNGSQDSSGTVVGDLVNGLRDVLDKFSN